MRTRILAAGFLLLVLGGVSAYFVGDVTRFWPKPAPVVHDLDQNKPITTSEEARKKYAFVSVRGQVPTGKPIAPGQPLAAEVEQYWQQIESMVGQSDRGELLKALHEKTRDIFVERPGAGWGRMKPQSPGEILQSDIYAVNPRQPGEPAAFPISASEPVAEIKPGKEFREIHQAGVLSFLPARSFGYIKDRDHVAGFRPHGFRHPPYTHPMHIQHVLLVGILTHEQPVVYLTENLPIMEKLRQAKVRPLDFFEEAGMPALRRGEDLYLASKDDTLRMLGALRATKTCQKCHDAEIGDLLGAFSYTLRPAPKAKDGDQRGQP